jgi:hypothetical protein
MTFTYDVTAISPDGERVPLTALTPHASATAIAKARSRDAHWNTVEVRESNTGNLVFTYADGLLRP